MADSPALSLAADNPCAAAVLRGICRLFARNDIWCLAEMPLRNGRRADLMGVDAKGRIVIVEIKVSRADLLGVTSLHVSLSHDAGIATAVVVAEGVAAAVAEEV